MDGRTEGAHIQSPAIFSQPRSRQVLVTWRYHARKPGQRGARAQGRVDVQGARGTRDEQAAGSVMQLRVLRLPPGDGVARSRRAGQPGRTCSLAHTTGTPAVTQLFSVTVQKQPGSSSGNGCAAFQCGRTVYGRWDLSLMSFILLWISPNC